MENVNKTYQRGLGRLLNKLSLKLRPKLILIFLLVKVIPIVVLTAIALTQITTLGNTLRNIAVADSSRALNDSARESIERLTTDTAASVANFLRQRDQDILLLARLVPSEETFRDFSQTRTSPLTVQGEWVLSYDEMTWVQKEARISDEPANVSRNRENEDKLLESGFRYRVPELFEQEDVPLYDEITFVDKAGNEVCKYVTPDNQRKKNYPLNPNTVNVADRTNTYIKAETYFEELMKLGPGDIFVSEVIGAYVGTNYIGMYTPGVLKNNVPEAHPNYAELQEIAFLPQDAFIEQAKKQAYAGRENPVGQRFEGIIRWATPVTSQNGAIVGYVTMALNHDHIMEFVDHITPMLQRYTPLPSAHEGNYAFIWDYECRSICHPRHHSIVGYNPLTGEPQVPWLEGSYEMERDYRNGGFLKDEEGNPILVLEDGEPSPARDTPFYQWYAGGGSEWLEANPRWNELSEQAAGVSWGAFLEANREDRQALPQFGERTLTDSGGNPVLNAQGMPILDYQSRDKTPAAALTKAGFVALDGRFLNNAPQCTGWMDLTEQGGSGSFYILWSGIYKPTTAGAIPYYTGQYAPEKQNGSKRGFAFVTIGAGIEDFTAPAREMGVALNDTIDSNLFQNVLELAGTSIVLFAIVILMAVFLSSYLTGNIEMLLDGLSRFRSGQRQFRLKVDSKDEFGTMADSFNALADSIVDSVNDPLSIIDSQHKVIYMNDPALSLLGRTLDETMGTSYDETSLYPAGSAFDPITALHEGKEAEVLYLKEREQYFRGVANYLQGQNGEKMGYLIVTNDVTEIEVARLRAEQANRAKSDFLSNMSHEMRTPLNAIIGMTSIGANSPDAEKKNYALGKIQDASSHLLGVINDVLDMSKIEANKFTLSVEEFSVEKMLQRVVDVINFQVDVKRQKLTVRIDPAIPKTLIGDDQRLAQVISNLLTNAVKFTPHGGAIHLEARLLPEQDGLCVLSFLVRDTGIGISDEQCARLFSAFSQAEASTSRKYGGTGLGLVISKNIVEMMGGHIGVESELGAGATFSFTVCLARGKEEHKPLLSPGLQPGNVRILAVDDDPDVLEFFEDAARQIGVACETALDGPQALSLIERKGPFNIFFIDWNMPGMNGIDLARAVNDIGSGNAVIIMISATDWNEIQEAAQAAGVNRFMPKPLFVSSIAGIVENCLRSSSDAQWEELETVIDLRGHCILLAEDVEINREIVLTLLEPTNLEIDCAENGAVAVEMFTKNPTRYDMIFMDVQMPEMDGYTATEMIRAADTPTARDIPIVAMTANVFQEDVEKCLSVGMNDHIGKPIDYDELMCRLEKFIGKEGTSA